VSRFLSTSSLASCHSERLHGQAICFSELSSPAGSIPSRTGMLARCLFLGRKRMAFSRRDFLATTALGSLALGLEAQENKTQDSRRSQTLTVAGKRPIVVCANNGLNYLEEGFNMIRGGADTLDAALRVIRGPEDD